MDSADSWLLNCLQVVLPPDYLQFFIDHFFHPSSAVQTLKLAATENAHRLTDAMQPILGPILDRVTVALNASPDIVVLTFVLVVLFLVIQVLNWMRRVVMFWTRLAFRAIFWAAVAVLVATVWQRGAQASMRDAVVIGSKLLGYAAAVRDIWLLEYRKWEAQAHR